MTRRPRTAVAAAGAVTLTSAAIGVLATAAADADPAPCRREEVVWRTSDSSALRIYSTPEPTDLRLTTLLHDARYRVAIAWQNSGYNQPPHLGFHLGDGMSTVARPDIYVC
jgi:hypothetical protein